MVLRPGFEPGSAAREDTLEEILKRYFAFFNYEMCGPKRRKSKKASDVLKAFEEAFESVRKAYREYVRPFEEVKRVISQAPAFNIPFYEEEEFVINWLDERDDFITYLKARKYSEKYVKDIISFLDRYLRRPVSTPKDVIEIFAPLTPSQAHHLNRAFRVLLKYLQVIKKFPEDFLDGLRQAIPKDELRGAIDLKIPSEEEIIDDLRRINTALPKYAAVYNLLLDSGLRLVEAVELINTFDESKAEKLDGFYRYPAGMFRRTKQAYYAYFTSFTLNLIKRVEKPLEADNASKFFRTNKYTRPKYIRKFVYDKMTSEEIGIPDSVADFIEGRVPKTIGSMHYTKLRRKADQFYQRWAKYVTELRRKSRGSSK